MTTTSILSDILQTLPSIKAFHARTTKPYQLLEKITKPAVEQVFHDNSSEKKPFEPFGNLSLPFFSMGAVNTLDLFGLDELVIFSFYWINRHRYKKALDIGANIGLHSILLSKCGYSVESFEPDPKHFAKLQEMLALNDINNIVLHQAAVSIKDGTAEFVRVIGNTTSSHLAGSKQPYGDLERFTVPVFDIKKLISSADLIKMDVESHEDQIIMATTKDDWKNTDAFVEIGTEENAEKIYAHLSKLQINMFAQKLGWEKVKKSSDMPISYREGSLFISSKKEMPWE
ncbi:MAG: FkbM family methyltransferase [Chlamydiales bacterium]|nr:FkbM family methyltransferase [Chlamydiales bacterium]